MHKCVKHTCTSKGEGLNCKSKKMLYCKGEHIYINICSLKRKNINEVPPLKWGTEYTKTYIIFPTFSLWRSCISWLFFEWNLFSRGDQRCSVQSWKSSLNYKISASTPRVTTMRAAIRITITAPSQSQRGIRKFQTHLMLMRRQHQESSGNGSGC